MINWTFLLLEFGTMGISHVVNVAVGFNASLKLFEEGYFVDEAKAYDLQNNGNYLSLELPVVVKVIKKIFHYIPGINIISELTNSFYVKKHLYNEAKVNNCLIKVSDKDLEFYNSLNNVYQKLLFYSQLSSGGDGEEIIGFNGDIPIIKVDPDLSVIRYEKLPELDYNLNDVKHLNNLTGYTYRVGTVDGKNIAIFGIPSANLTFNKLKFYDENYSQVHNFKIMDQDEAKHKTFTVYPFTYEDRFENDIEEAIEEMRLEKQDDSSLEDEDIFAFSYEDNSSLEDEDIFDFSYDNNSNSLQEEGPVLRRGKTIKKK